MTDAATRTWSPPRDAPTPLHAPRWDHPPVERFERRFAEREHARPRPIVDADATLFACPPTATGSWRRRIARGELACVRPETRVALAVESPRRRGKGFAITISFADSAVDHALELGTPVGHGPRTLEPGREYFFQYNAQLLRLRVVATTPERTPTGTHFADWAYTATLTDLTAPLYEPHWDAPFSAETEIYERFFPDGLNDATPEQFEAAIRWLPGRSALGAVGVLLDEARMLDEPRLACELARRHEAWGRCGNSPVPAVAALAYANDCFVLGRVVDGLHLCMRAAEGPLAREPWRRWTNPGLPRGGDDLARPGIDVVRFLRGALLRFDGVRRRAYEPTPGALAAVMRETGRVPEMTTMVAELALDPTLDALNRLGATIAWAELLAGQIAASQMKPLDDLASLARACDLLALCPELDAWSRRWLAEW